MGYLCGKPVTLAGHRYSAGDIIPDGAVLKQRERALTGMGYIRKAAEAREASPADMPEKPSGGLEKGPEKARGNMRTQAKKPLKRQNTGSERGTGKSGRK